MTSVRAPAVAGMFYPGDPEDLDRSVAHLLGTPPAEPSPFKAIVAPHAGYPYSGPVAGTAYAAVRHLAGQIRRVVLLGPAHRVGFRGIAAPGADGLATPLGTIPVDRAAIATVLDLPGVQVLDQAFAGEHALEVHLPFLQHIFPGVGVVPLLVGDTRPELVDRVLERLWGGPETLIVISSDLSHYQDYETARRLDLETSQAIEALQGHRLNGHFACGFLPLSGLLRRAVALDLRATTLDLRNSGDTAGGRDQVVGYGAYGFEYAATARLPDSGRTRLLEAARQALAIAAETGRVMAVDPADYPLALRAVRRTFVTLTRNGQLRGCIGTLTATNPLVVDLVENAFRAGMQDPRFGAVTPEEVAEIAVSISILSHPRPIAFTGEAHLLEQLRPEVDGLILRDGNRQALFLPKVWHDLPMPAQFLRQLKLKAGLAPDQASATLQALRFTTETFPADA
jgi:AmmeMemoRadiSam system protein B/AmmeMemoRadiSam system protein A